MKKLLPSLIMLIMAMCLHNGASAASASAKKLGRLFSTPAERDALDRQRQSVKNGGTVLTGQLAEQESSAVMPQQYTLNGFVKRGDGKETMWLNQVASEHKRKAGSVKVEQHLAKSPVVSVKLPNGKNVVLKPGQTFDIASAKTSDVYEQPAPDKKAQVQR